jgi:hypothetical protein
VLPLSKSIPAGSGTAIAQAFDERAATRNTKKQETRRGTLKAEGKYQDEDQDETGRARSNFSDSSGIHSCQRGSGIFADKAHAPPRATPGQVLAPSATTGWADISHDQFRL